ncbi:MAG: hypothetical protein AAGC95_16350 [Pseudomonadota bacterium]
MSLVPGVLPPKDNDGGDDFFMGYAKAPKVDRRFWLGAAPLALLGTTGLSAAFTHFHSDPGAGAWLTGETFAVTGVLDQAPYPIIRIADAATPGGVRTVLVVAEGKCTSGLPFDSVLGQAATVNGVLIERKGRMMLEVPLLLDKWLTPLDMFDAADKARLSSPTTEALGPVRLKGAIMDTKCFFGVMRPGRGKTHKACAALCIRGGIPPSFYAVDEAGRETVLLLTDANGEALKDEILPLVADPLVAEGEIVRVDDLFHFRVAPENLKRA